MARKREGTVRETRSQLQELLRLHHHTEFEPRLRMLSLLASEDAATFAETAAQLGCSERTVRRWWKQYQDAGLDALLRDPAPEQSAARPDGRRRSGSPIHIDIRLQRFLSSIPTCYESSEWIRNMRDSLVAMLDDVDRAIVSVNVLNNARGEEERDAMSAVFVTQHTTGEEQDAITSQPWDDTPGEMIFADATYQGFPAEEYGKPAILDYRTPNNAYLGTIILLRRNGSPAISRHTLDLLENLRPFLIFLFTDCVVRHKLRHPSHATFTDTISAIVERYELTNRQGEVLMHQVLGRTYNEIAEIMDISPNTVHRYIVSIHERTGSRNLNELFTHTITPTRTDTDTPPEFGHLPDLK